MARPFRLVGKRRKRFGGQRETISYRAVTCGADREDWAVVDDRGDVIWRGDARVAAMIASRLTKPVG